MRGQYKSTTFNLADCNMECKVDPKKTCFDGRAAKFFWESNNVATSQTRRVDKIEPTRNNLQLTSQKNRSHAVLILGRFLSWLERK